MRQVRKSYVPDGHYYSPIVNIDEVEKDQGRIWPESPEMIGIDFNREGHERLLSEEFPRYIGDYDYPDEEPADGRGRRFFNNNTSYSLLDARSLFVMLRMIRPRRMIEIGCGTSTLLTADVNTRFLDGSIEVTCIEPYPHQFLREQIPGISRLIEARIQDVRLEVFDLDAGDVLFIDTSHVSKTGSDVNHIYFEILPRLRPGVIIHIHDISFPHDYPKGWIYEGRSWNEQYLVRAMLTETWAWKVLFSGSYAYYCMNDSLAKALGGHPLGGCSLWLERVDPHSPDRLLEGIGTRKLVEYTIKRVASKLLSA
jgi:predicted O-methyltransferase YrrM